MRAVQLASLGALAPFFTRTPLLSWAFCLLGAHIGQGALLDTARLQDPQLVSIGQCSVLGTDVAAAGVTVAPAGALGDNKEPVMLVSEVGGLRGLLCTPSIAGLKSAVLGQKWMSWHLSKPLQV